MGATRIRTRTEPSSNGHHVQTDFAGNVQIDEYPVKPPAYSQTTSDVVIPRFRERSAAGEIFINPFRTDKTWYASTGTFHAEDWESLNPKNRYRTYHWDGGSLLDINYVPYAPEPVFTEADYARLVDLAKTQCAAAVNKTDTMPLVSVAEWHKTKALHRDIGKAFIGMVQAVYAKNPGRYTARMVSNAWMVGRYGVRPLLYDLQGAVSLLTKPSRERYTARGKAVEERSTTLNPTMGDSFATYSVTSTCVKEVTVRTGLLYETNDLLRFYAKAGFTRPLSSAWELVKFSWVFDWWVNMGEWLDAMQPDGATKQLAAWITVNTRTSHTTVVNGVTITQPSAKARSWDGNRVKIIESKTRDVWSGVPPISPTRKGGPKGLQCADAVALVTQFFGWKSGGGVRGVKLARL